MVFYKPNVVRKHTHTHTKKQTHKDVLRKRKVRMYFKWNKKDLSHKKSVLTIQVIHSIDLPGCFPSSTNDNLFLVQIVTPCVRGFIFRPVLASMNRTSVVICAHNVAKTSEPPTSRPTHPRTNCSRNRHAPRWTTEWPTDRHSSRHCWLWQWPLNQVPKHRELRSDLPIMPTDHRTGNKSTDCL